MPPKRFKKKTWRKKRTYKYKRKSYNKTKLGRQLRIPYQSYRSKRTVSFEYNNTNFNSSGFLSILPFITAETFANPQAGSLAIVVNDFNHFKDCFAMYRISGCAVKIQTTQQVYTSNDNITMVVAPLSASGQPTTFEECINLRSKLGPMSTGKSARTASGRSWYSRASVADYTWKYSTTSSDQTWKYASPVRFSTVGNQTTIRHFLPSIHLQTLDDNAPSSDWKMFIHFTVYCTYSVER